MDWRPGVTEEKIQTDYGGFENGKLETLERSILPLSFVEDAYLQSDSWMREDFKQVLTFRAPTVRKVEEFGAEHAVDWESAVFVHVRRGDYLDWNVFGKGSPALPNIYYRKGLERLRGKMPVTRVIFVTDDPGFVEQRIR